MYPFKLYNIKYIKFTLRKLTIASEEHTLEQEGSDGTE